MTTQEKLAAPFPPEKVSWRPGKVSKKTGKAMALAYIDSRDVQDRLNEVFGIFGWQNCVEYINNAWVSTISVKDPDSGEWVCKSDGSDESDIEASKGGISGALKRAAVLLGIGRYLYDIDSPWMELDEYKQFTPASLKRLQALLGKSSKIASKAPETPSKSQTPSEPSTNPQKGRQPGEPCPKPSPEKDPEKEAAPQEADEKADAEPAELFKGPFYKQAKSGGPKGFLEICGEQKERIGARAYYFTLEEAEIEKANQVGKTNRALQMEILTALKAVKDWGTVDNFATTLKSQLAQAKKLAAMSDPPDTVFLQSVMGLARSVKQNSPTDRLREVGDQIEIILSAKEGFDGTEETND
jgi:hypothetical protein